MRAFINSLLALCLLLMAFGAFSYFGDKTVTFSLPPESLKQWYKPANERQVWLHVMFNLRREMQAISEYAASGDQARLLKWTQKLVKDYKKAGELVPEWKQRMKPHLADELLAAVQDNNLENIKHTQHQLERICTQCHNKYQIITATIYRSADVSNIDVTDSSSKESSSYKDTMETLSLVMNRIIINMADQNFTNALSSAAELEQRLDDLGETCAHCHKGKSALETILGSESRARFEHLRELLAKKDINKAGGILGEIAVSSCARCHSIHRMSSDMRKELVN
ncbi:MAG: hypothetical protein OEY89_11995 [Gammaproteobacteria bacterium]|nr:hypothetical protein [Gammaproteobacteria bacterium]